MILPTKHIPTAHSLLGVAALVLSSLERPRTLTALWDRLCTEPQVGTFGRLILALDLLYAVGAVDFDEGLLRRTVTR
mgnify:CR=1 FL=1